MLGEARSQLSVRSFKVRAVQRSAGGNVRQECGARVQGADLLHERFVLCVIIGGQDSDGGEPSKVVLRVLGEVVQHLVAGVLPGVFANLYEGSSEGLMGARMG
jgi:hypothetical protein